MDFDNIKESFDNKINKLFDGFRNNNSYIGDKKQYNLNNFRISELLIKRNLNEPKYLKEMNSQLSHINNIRSQKNGFNIRKLINSILDVSSVNTCYEQKSELIKKKYKLNLNNYNILILIQDLFDSAVSKIKYINQELSSNISIPSIEDLINQPHSKYTGLQNLVFTYLKYKRGQRGEDLVFKDTKFENSSTNKIIRDVNLNNSYGNYKNYSNRRNNQMDEVIINPKGIFIPEIKYYNAKKIILTKNGNIYAFFKNGNEKRFGNIVSQLTKHENTIKKFLLNIYNNDKLKNKLINLDIISFIVCANDNVDSESCCNNNNIYYPNTFYHSLINRHYGSVILSKDDINKIYKLISDESKKDEKYNDKLVFSSCFIYKIIALLIYIKAIFKLDQLAKNHHINEECEEHEEYEIFGVHHNDRNSDEGA